jgi:Iap family predicted aminopeptidase
LGSGGAGPANGAQSKFTADSPCEDPNHCEGWYDRSDQLSYARAGIPGLVITTLRHADHHTAFENPDESISKLTKMTRRIYATGAWRRTRISRRPPRQRDSGLESVLNGLSPTITLALKLCLASSTVLTACWTLRTDRGRRRRSPKI